MRVLYISVYDIAVLITFLFCFVSFEVLEVACPSFLDEIQEMASLSPASSSSRGQSYCSFQSGGGEVWMQTEPAITMPHVVLLNNTIVCR